MLEKGFKKTLTEDTTNVHPKCSVFTGKKKYCKQRSNTTNITCNIQCNTVFIDIINWSAAEEQIAVLVLEISTLPHRLC